MSIFSSPGPSWFSEEWFEGVAEWLESDDEEDKPPPRRSRGRAPPGRSLPTGREVGAGAGDREELW